MHKTARQRYVLDILSEHGQASITDLAEKLQVSADTIRRDLTDLENQGLAQKNHGGAIALNLSTAKGGIGLADLLVRQLSGGAPARPAEAPAAKPAR